MSLARAFTTRRLRKHSEVSSETSPKVDNSKYAFPSGSIRHKISAPVELLSTTNMLSYNAPDIFPVSSSPPSLVDSSGSSSHSRSSGEFSIATPPPTSPELEVEIEAEVLSKNHLSCYFEKREASSSSEDVSAPVIPSRAPSHTKRNHEIVHRKRSIHRVSGQYKHAIKNSLSGVTRDSLQMFSAQNLVQEVSEPDADKSCPATPTISTESSPVQAQHPFSAELAQLTELAEDVDFGSVKILDEEDQWLASRGLFRFDASDYLAEVQSCYETFNSQSATQQIWI